MMISFVISTAQEKCPEKTMSWVTTDDFGHVRRLSCWTSVEGWNLPLNVFVGALVWDPWTIKSEREVQRREYNATLFEDADRLLESLLFFASLGLDLTESIRKRSSIVVVWEESEWYNVEH